VIVPHYHDAKQSERKGAERQKNEMHDCAYHVESGNVSSMRPPAMLAGLSHVAPL